MEPVIVHHFLVCRRAAKRNHARRATKPQSRGTGPTGGTGRQGQTSPSGTARRADDVSHREKNLSFTSAFTTNSAGHSPANNFTIACAATNAMSSRDFRSTPAV